MRYIILRKADKNTEAGILPGENLITAMAEYNKAMVDAGVFASGEGLRASSFGYRLSFHDGVPEITSGPFPDTGELLAGYTIIEVDSDEAALEWAKKWPKLDGEGEAQLELRRLFELSDFEPGSGIEKHRELCGQIGTQPQAINAYLNFNGNCKEAFEFYAECLGGKIVMLLLAKDSLMADQMGPEMQDKVMHVCLQVGKWYLMGSDCPPDKYQQPQGFNVLLQQNDQEKAKELFERFSEKGIVQMPLEPTFWADLFGMVVDRFGTPWMINCGQRM